DAEQVQHLIEHLPMLTGRTRAQLDLALRLQRLDQGREFECFGTCSEGDENAQQWPTSPNVPMLPGGERRDGTITRHPIKPTLRRDLVRESGVGYGNSRLPRPVAWGPVRLGCNHHDVGCKAGIPVPRGPAWVVWKTRVVHELAPLPPYRFCAAAAHYAAQD